MSSEGRTAGDCLEERLKRRSSGLKTPRCRLRCASLDDRKPSNPCTPTLGCASLYFEKQTTTQVCCTGIGVLILRELD